VARFTPKVRSPPHVLTWTAVPQFSWHLFSRILQNSCLWSEVSNDVIEDCNRRKSCAAIRIFGRGAERGQDESGCGIFWRA